MRKQKSYYINLKNFLTILSFVMIFCAAAAGIVALMTEIGNGNELFWKLYIPTASEILFVIIGICCAKERLYRTSTIIAIFCVSKIFFAFSYDSNWKKLAVILIYIVFTILYFRMLCGNSNNRILLVAFEVAALAIEIYCYRNEISTMLTVPVHSEFAQLFATAGVLFFTLSLQEYHDGMYHKLWGDRSDGRMVRSLDPMTYVGVYIMPNRNGADNMFRDTLDVTEIDKYIHKKRRLDIPHLTITQIYLAAYCRTIARYPALNRFIGGQRIYTRGDDIIFNMMVKKEMSVEGEETYVTLHLTPNETIYTVSEKLDAAVRDAKAEGASDFDNVAALLKAIPGLLMKFTVWFLKLLDYFGLLPGFLLEVSPFHGTIFFTSMASLGIPAITHHLYDFGNLPVFCCLGTKYRKNVMQEDGTVQERKYMDYTVNCDERICDGFYYASAFKTFKKIIANPESLEVPPESVVHDVD